MPTADPAGFAGPPEVFVRDAGQPVDFALAPDGTLYYVAIGANAVRRILPQTGTSTVCARALGAHTPAWALQADASIRRCRRQDGSACFPPPGYSPKVSAGLNRRIERRCGSAPPPELCTRLVCAPCLATAELTDCIADQVTDYVVSTQRAVFEADEGRCG